ncbi:YegP family protein [Agromyces sp. NPDC056965]|uniref:YegP family protein n=1 Tax=Agromyces sp. NPDC056965 TaxID=3345983 RepID=UPI003643C042
MAGTFELYEDASGQFRFRLKAGNGQTIAASEAYTTKAAAQNGIESVRTNAPDAPIVDQTA